MMVVFFWLVVGRSLERFVIAYETHLTVYAFYEFVCDYFWRIEADTLGSRQSLALIESHSHSHRN